MTVPTRMPAPVSNAVLDAVLSVQLLVSWAGESAGDSPRLGWWRTDLVDPLGGGDLLARLCPKTHAWSGLEAAREAARRVDEKARGALAAPDDLRTLFFFGFEVDERLAERLADLKRSGRPPADALRLSQPGATFSREALIAALAPPGSRGVRFEVVPGGRRVLGPQPEVPDQLARNLTAALVPLADRYPLPFYRLERA